MKFFHISDKIYTQTITYYTEKGHLEAEKYFNYLYNAAERYVETGDFTHLNYAVKASKAVQRFRKTMRVIDVLSAHKFSTKMGLYYGTADSEKLRKLRHNNAWISKFKKAVEDEVKHEQQKPEWNWETKRAGLIRAVKLASEHGVSHQDIMKAVIEGEKKAADAA